MRFGSLVLGLLVLAFVALCALAIWQPGRWLYLFTNKPSGAIFLAIAVIAVYGLTRSSK
jgi:hypothetical protein